MSKWGQQYARNILLQLNRQGGKQEVADMVDEMSQCILAGESELAKMRKEISAQKTQLLEQQIQLTGARASEAHLKGYVERVRELDPGHKDEKEET